MKNKGFTLIETLIVISIFITVGSIGASIFISSLKGTNKANVVGDIRQSGNYTLSQMSKIIRSAKKFEGIYDDSIPQFVTSCVIPVVDSTDPQLKITSFQNEIITLKCLSNPANIVAESVGSTYFLDNGKVILSSCRFECRQSTTSNPIITINFSLTQANAEASYDKSASIPFQTSIVIRNK